jgi:hypothetical protein
MQLPTSPFSRAKQSLSGEVICHESPEKCYPTPHSVGLSLLGTVVHPDEQFGWLSRPRGNTESDVVLLSQHQWPTPLLKIRFSALNAG